MIAVWMVLDHPPDYPGKIVVRQFLLTERGAVPAVGEDGLEVLRYHDDLTQARRILRGWGLTPRQRQPEDDPLVIERWS